MPRPCWRAVGPRQMSEIVPPVHPSCAFASIAGDGEAAGGVGQHDSRWCPPLAETLVSEMISGVVPLPLVISTGGAPARGDCAAGGQLCCYCCRWRAIRVDLHQA